MINEPTNPHFSRKNQKFVGLLAAAFAAICLLFACIACAGFQLFNPGTPAGDYSLVITNETGEDVCSLTLKVSSSQTRFGADQLRGILQPGDSFTITGLAEGYYDVRAGRCADPSDWYRHDAVPVLSSSASWTFR